MSTATHKRAWKQYRHTPPNGNTNHDTSGTLQNTYPPNNADLNYSKLHPELPLLILQDSKLIKQVQTGACWSGHFLFKAGHINTEACPYCGHPKHTMEHIIWHCPHHHEARQAYDPLLAKYGPKYLPPALLHGIAPALHQDPQHTYWGSSIIPSDLDAVVLFGATTIPPEASQALLAMPFQHSGYNTRQLLASIRTRSDLRDPPNPGWSDQELPQNPNIYTDGGVWEACNPHLALGGFGVHYPNDCPPGNTNDTNRNPNDGHLTTHDNEGTNHTQGMYAAIKHHITNSTRCEIAALIIAIATRGPIHIATDSKSALQIALTTIRLAYTKARDHAIRNNITLQQALHETAETNPHAKPWSLLKDGDLRRVLWQAIAYKNLKSITISKVKAHATKADLDAGRISPRSLQANQNADNLATKGIATHCPSAHGLHTHLAKRTKAYTNLMARIHQFMAVILRHDQHHRNANQSVTNLALNTTPIVDLRNALRWPTDTPPTHTIRIDPNALRRFTAHTYHRGIWRSPQPKHLA